MRSITRRAGMMTGKNFVGLRDTSACSKINCKTETKECISAMKKVFLLGDSIRKGYDKYVELAFEGKALVYYPKDNCRFAAYTLRHLSLWKKETGCGDDVDVVHWNVGLWDILRMQDGEPLTEINVYRDYVDRICKILKMLFPNAALVFATSTAVQEHLFDYYTRKNSDIREYNAVAVEVVKAHGGTITDLYALTESASSEYYSDATHFNTKEGTKLITERVIVRLEEVLGMKAEKLDYDRLFVEQKDIIGI